MDPEILGSCTPFPPTRRGHLTNLGAFSANVLFGAVVGLLGELVVGLSPLGGPHSARALLRGKHGLVVRVGGSVGGAGGLVVPHSGLGVHRPSVARRPIVVGHPGSTVLIYSLLLVLGARLCVVVSKLVVFAVVVAVL